jgi:putative heme-binding domain-containing protein
LRLSEPWLAKKPALLKQVMGMTNDPEPAVLLQVALTLGEIKDEHTLIALVTMARAHGNIQWMPNAILSSVPQCGGQLLEDLLRAPQNLGAAKSLITPLCAAIGARHNEKELGESLQRIAAVSDASLRANCLRGLQTGLKGARDVALSGVGHQALGKLLKAEAPEVHRLAVALNGVFRSLDPAARKALLAEATRTLANVTLPAEARLTAVTELAYSDDPDATAALLAAWPASTPKVRDAILDAVFSRPNRLPALLETVEKGTIPARGLSAFQRVTLLENEQAEIRSRAAKLFNKPSGANEETFRKFTAALANSRDKVHGERVFRDLCSTCHKVRGIGAAVGPDLGAEFQRAEEAILKDVLAPNDTISAGYPTYVIDTANGQSVSGILASESATSITLRIPTGVEQTVLRKDISRFASLPVSLMPEGLSEAMTPQDLADAIAWLRDTGGAAVVPDSVVLFDDEPEFIEKLTEGKGLATFETEGAYSGTGCLTMSGFQRHSSKIPGWNYVIAEKPAPGEYRYLRLAWKARGAECVLVELAVNGRWPDPKSSRGRYFAGKNVSEWNAKSVSSTVPVEWRVVTVDLWKDCGAFNLTGIAPTTFGGTSWFDKIELLRDLKSTTAEGK